MTPISKATWILERSLILLRGIRGLLVRTCMGIHPALQDGCSSWFSIGAHSLRRDMALIPHCSRLSSVILLVGGGFEVHALVHGGKHERRQSTDPSRLREPRADDEQAGTESGAGSGAGTRRAGGAIPG